MVPSVGVYTPVSILKQVVFPAPFGPISPYNCPFSIVMLNPSTARSPPKEIPRFLPLIMPYYLCLLFAGFLNFLCDTLSHLNTFWCPIEKHHYDQNDGIDQHTIILQSTEHLRSSVKMTVAMIDPRKLPMPPNTTNTRIMMDILYPKFVGVAVTVERLCA